MGCEQEPSGASRPRALVCLMLVWQEEAPQEQHLDILFLFFCLMRVSPQIGKGPRPMHSGPQGKSDLCVQRADWTSDTVSLFLCSHFSVMVSVDFKVQVVPAQVLHFGC